MNPFPIDPEQWIYAKAHEIKMQLSIFDRMSVAAKAGAHGQQVSKSHIDLAIEVHCLKMAIASYSKHYLAWKGANSMETIA